MHIYIYRERERCVVTVAYALCANTANRIHCIHHHRYTSRGRDEIAQVVLTSSLRSARCRFWRARP